MQVFKAKIQANKEAAAKATGGAGEAPRNYGVRLEGVNARAAQAAAAPAVAPVRNTRRHGVRFNRSPLEAAASAAWTENILAELADIEAAAAAPPAASAESMLAELADIEAAAAAPPAAAADGNNYRAELHENTRTILNVARSMGRTNRILKIQRKKMLENFDRAIANARANGNAQREANLKRLADEYNRSTIRWKSRKARRAMLRTRKNNRK